MNRAGRRFATLATARGLVASCLIAGGLSVSFAASAGHALPFLKKKTEDAATNSDKMPPPDKAMQAKLDRAALQMQNKDYKNARITYKALFVERPFDPQVLLGIAQAAERCGDLDEALKYARECTVAAPNEPSGHIALGGYLEENRDMKAAYLQYARVLDLNPPKEVLDRVFGPTLRVLMTLSATADGARQVAEAQKLARKWAKDYPADADCQYNLGWVLAQCGDELIPDAVAAYRAALKLNPANVGIHYNLALLLLKSRQNSEAFGELQQFLKLAPQDSDAPRAKELIDKLQSKATTATAPNPSAAPAAASDQTPGGAATGSNSNNPAANSTATGVNNPAANGADATNVPAADAGAGTPSAAAPPNSPPANDGAGSGAVKPSNSAAANAPEQPAASDSAKPQDQAAAKGPNDTPAPDAPANQSTTIMMQPLLEHPGKDEDPALLAYQPLQLADSDTAAAQRQYQPTDGADLIGTKAPEFSGLEWIGKPYTLAQLRGKVVLIRFWLADCYLCANSAPALNTLYKRYGDKGLVVVGIHHPKSPEVRQQSVVERAAGRNGFAFPIAIDNDWKTINSLWLRGKKHPFTSASLLIDRNGIIRWVHPGGELLLDEHSKGNAQTAFASLEHEVQLLLAED